MSKHILYQALWQCFTLFLFLFAGEYLIPESDAELMYDRPNGYIPAEASLGTKKQGLYPASDSRSK